MCCRSQRLRQAMDLRDTDKSLYFAITEWVLGNIDTRVSFTSLLQDVRTQDFVEPGFEGIGASLKHSLH